MTYHAVNKQGDFQTNAAAGPNAVTWGVFPSAEIIQPTVVDGMAFKAWKDEAFELGNIWGQFYDKASPETGKMIKQIFENFYLGELRLSHSIIIAWSDSRDSLIVNVVDNDYRNPNDSAIFEPFLNLDLTKSMIDGTKKLHVNGSSSLPVTNGHA